MIRYRLTILAGGYDCTFQGTELVIGLDEGRPSFQQSTGAWVNIGDIEVYVSGDDSTFKIIGKELNGATDVDDPAELSVPTSDPGEFLGWSRGTLDRYDTLELEFSAPEQLNSQHKWVFSDYSAPTLKLTVKVKRQQVSGSCSSWPVILPPV